MSKFELQAENIPVTDVLNACVFGIVIVDSDYSITVWNTWFERYTSINKEEALGKSLFDVFPEMQNTRLHATVDSAIKQSSSSYLSQALNKTPFPLKNPRKNNELIQHAMSIKPIRMVNGTRCCMIQVEDVTAAVKRETQLKILMHQAEIDKHTAQNLVKMKSNFMSTVSHELRTPLTSISGALNLITNRIAGDIPEQLVDMIELAQRNTERLLNLVNDILDIDKIESGMMSYTMEKINVIDLLQQAVAENKGLAVKLNINFHISECSNDLYIEADHDRLMQVMCNLMSNAAKFSPPNEQVSIGARLDNNQVRINVTDNGSGISKDFRRSIFDKFTQDKKTDAPHPGGTGLGLAICQTIIQQHHGEIDFICPKEGGTEFFFLLPAISDQ